jgi:hypothetical protein
MKRSKAIASLCTFLEDMHPERYKHTDGDVTLKTEADLILEFLEELGMSAPGWSIPGTVYYMGDRERRWEEE